MTALIIGVVLMLTSLIVGATDKAKGWATLYWVGFGFFCLSMFMLYRNGVL